MTARRGNGTAQGGVARQQPVDRITIALIREAEKHLQQLQDRTGLSKTDIVNRAITLYEFIEGQLRAERDLLIHDQRTGENHAVLIL